MAPSGGTESCYQLVNEGSVTSQKPVSAWLPHPGNWKLETGLVAGRGIPSAGVIQGEVALQAALALPPTWVKSAPKATRPHRRQWAWFSSADPEGGVTEGEATVTWQGLKEGLPSMSLWATQVRLGEWPPPLPSRTTPWESFQAGQAAGLSPSLQYPLAGHFPGSLSGPAHSWPPPGGTRAPETPLLLLSSSLNPLAVGKWLRPDFRVTLFWVSDLASLLTDWCLEHVA